MEQKKHQKTLLDRNKDERNDMICGDSEEKHDVSWLEEKFGDGYKRNVLF